MDSSEAPPEVNADENGLLNTQHLNQSKNPSEAGVVVNPVTTATLDMQLSNQSTISNSNTDNSAQGINFQLPDQSTIPSETFDSTQEESFKVQFLNVQLIDQSKIDKCISNTVTLIKDNFRSFKLYIDTFIQVYNKKKLKEKIDIKYVFLKQRHVDDIYQISYKRDKTMTPNIAKSEEINPDETNSSNYILFFLPEAKSERMNNIFAATTCEAWEVVRPYADYSFPIKIIERVGSQGKIMRIERRFLFESSRKEKLFLPTAEDLYNTSSLFYLVENLICDIDKKQDRGAKLFDFLESVADPSSTIDLVSLPDKNDTVDESSVKIDNTLDKSNGEGASSAKRDTSLDENGAVPKKKGKYERSFRIKITTAGSVNILERLKVRDYFGIIKLFDEFLSDKKPIVEHFDFLHFFKIPGESKSSLDDALIADIFRRYQSEQPQHVDVQHKYFEDFLLSDKYEIQITSKKNFKNIGFVAPDINQIIDEISTDDEETFKQQMKKGKLRFKYLNQKQCDPIIDYIEGEIFYNDQNYFKIRKMWYQTDADYLCLLQRDFEKVMDDVFIQEVETGSLPLPWIKNIPFTQEALRDYLACDKSDVKKLLGNLKNVKVSYVSNGEVMQKKLCGEILKIQEIIVNKNEIEYALEKLSEVGGKFGQEEFKEKMNDNEKKVSEKDLNVIWKNLNDKRHVLYVNKQKQTLVGNPFPYPLKKEEKYEKLTQFFTNLCKLDQPEGEYNRSYLYIDDSRDLKGHTYLVFDQICPDNIEPCDILSYTCNTLYLYHVKEKFAQDTRIVCSQILNSATRIQEALRTNQENNYLKSLWVMATKLPETGTKGFEFGSKLRAILLRDFDEKSFIDMFRHKNLVFVYAYRTPRGFRKSHDREKITNRRIKEACEILGFINKHGFLTTKFFHVTENEFVSEVCSKDKSITVGECKNTYELLAKRVFSKSTLAKMEVIRLAEKLGTFQNRFKLKVCEIPVE